VAYAVGVRAPSDRIGNDEIELVASLVANSGSAVAVEAVAIQEIATPAASFQHSHAALSESAHHSRPVADAADQRVGTIYAGRRL
jgi:hypothetical protein